ncbi:ribokinase [Mesorhizobium sp. VK22B]|uniref:Ribokinase n=1 Tax=Mesorhizobium captivum TaxID=3072319 RepID=A0ABU4Z3A7_9HYPH|nr:MULTISPECIES: ribokinase [unclassified Mesorhizobium]MDX8492517.1 ribokinase [Mesorhizobium sp. VK22B]MDX8505606.1 ribokinase [Mesorhizobium sp. VK22E]
MHAYVIGNVAVDETIRVEQWPLAGASIFGSHGSSDLGGKGANQAVIMARCGLATTLVAPVGVEFRAQSIADRLAAEPVECRLLRQEGKSSDFSIIFTTPDGENAIVTTTDAAENLLPEDALPAISEAQSGDLAVFQGNLSGATTEALLSEARRRGMVTAFNPSPLRPSFQELWPLVDIAFLNAGEALALTGASGEAAAAVLHARGVRDVVLTLGADGALLSGGGAPLRVAAMPASVMDTTGAGDTFMGVALASAFLRGARLDELALIHAARASALTVSRKGTLNAFPSIEEMSAILAQL